MLDRLKDPAVIIPFIVALLGGGAFGGYERSERSAVELKSIQMMEAQQKQILAYQQLLIDTIKEGIKIGKQSCEVTE